MLDGSEWPVWSAFDDVTQTWKPGELIAVHAVGNTWRLRPARQDDFAVVSVFILFPEPIWRDPLAPAPPALPLVV